MPKRIAFNRNILNTRNRNDTIYAFELAGKLHEDLGAASLRMTYTWHFFDNGTEQTQHQEYPLCYWRISWFQNGQKTCHLKAGELMVFMEPETMLVPPRNCSLSLRTTLWNGERKKVTDFESIVYGDRDDSEEKLEL